MRAIRVRLLPLAGALLLASCSDSSGPAPVASVEVSGAPGQPLQVGQTAQLSAVLRDGQGNALSGRAVTWRSSAAAAVVDSTGRVTAVGVGETTITATAEGRAGSAPVRVAPVPVAAVQLGQDAVALEVGQTLQLSATPLDAAGNPLFGRAVEWASSDTTRARVSASGLLSAAAAGTASVTATSEGRTATLPVVVRPFDPSAVPTVTAVTPATLSPGATAVIVGTGFDAGIANNGVTIRGVPATVVSATPSQLTVTVPCVGSGNAPVVVTSNGRSGAARLHPVAVASPTIAVGQALVLGSVAASECNELPAAGAGARYLVTVFNAATSQNTLVDFRLEGNTPAAGSAPPLRVMPRPPPAARATPADEAHAAHDDAHFARLERERALYEELRALTPASQLNRRQSARGELPQLGQMRTLYYNFGGCGDTTNLIRGRAIYVGSRAIIWEDSANALQSTADAALAGYYARLGEIFDVEQYAVVRDNFGDPLRRDPQTDNDGRVHMVFTQRLNGSGAAAYVTSCDQFPPSGSRASNFGEFFYGFVPTTTTPNINSTTAPDGWFYFMARTVVHEVKHIASQAARVANGAPSYEQSWLEEGTARHAEELWVRAHLHRVAWKANTGYGTAASNGVFCDFNPLNAACLAADALRRPSFGMRRHFNEIREKLVEPWNWSPYGTGTGQGGSVFYQTSWSMVRYIIDRYATSDAAFLTALNGATTSGTANLSAVAGAPIDRIVGLWGLALYADDFPGLQAPGADLQFPTWNLRDIYGGLNTDPAWRNRWSTPFPIQPLQLTFGSRFSAQQAGMRGGAHAYFEISGASAEPQLLNLRAVPGGALSPNLRIAIARLQ